MVSEGDEEGATFKKTFASLSAKRFIAMASRGVHEARKNWQTRTSRAKPAPRENPMEGAVRNASAPKREPAGVRTKLSH
jgi:hypothetical protein